MILSMGLEKIMKKIIFLILTMALTISLTACNSREPQSFEMTTNEHYELGDVILANTSIVKENELTELDSNNLPVAVIAALNDDGSALGIGVHRSDEPLQWTSEDAPCYDTKFTQIEVSQKSSDFIGDTDGSDNWNVICSEDSQGIVNDTGNYPAFGFVNTYAEAYKLTDMYSSDWYMPSIAELNTIYHNRDVINISLQKIYNLDNNAAMNGLGTTWYWSSSQAESANDYAWFIHYLNGYAGECPKNFTNLYVVAVRKF